MSNIDVLSLGDMTTDTFIKLQDSKAKISTDDQGKWLAMPFGQKIPYDHAVIMEAVGNAPNAAASFAKLGFKTSLMSNVGDDQFGRDMMIALKKSNVDTRFVHMNAHKVSNRNFILWYKEERTILVRHEDYDYHWPHLRPKEIPTWIYFSSIGQDSLEFHDDLAEWLGAHPQVNLAFQPGTYQIGFGAKRLRQLYARASVLVMNREEAVKVSGGKNADIHDLFNRLHDLGAKTVAITDGPAGAYASDGTERLFMPPYPDPRPPVERTGAGDAFTSTFVAAIMKGNTIGGALQWAPINSMNVVQHVGSRDGLLTEAQIASYLKKAPKDFQPKRI